MAIQPIADPYEYTADRACRQATWICPRCGKRRYCTWRHALADAKAIRHRRTGRRMTIYFSRPCQCVHIGERTPKPKGPLS